MIKGYIKVAHALLPSFLQILRHECFFGKDRIKIAPIKSFERCRMKVSEFQYHELPAAAYICDYLRATVLCDTIPVLESTLNTICNCDSFKVVRIKGRISLTEKDNKTILCNVVVKDPSIIPNAYSWSDWWKPGKVKMVAEV